MWGSLRTSVLKMLFEKLWKGAHTVPKAETRHGTYFGIIICFPVSTRSTAGRPSASCLQCTCSFPLFFTQRGRAKIIQRRDYTVPGQQERSCALTYINCSWDKNMTWEAKRDFSCPMHVTNEPTMPQWVTSGWPEHKLHELCLTFLSKQFSHSREGENISEAKFGEVKEQTTEIRGPLSLPGVCKILEITILRYVRRLGVMEKPSLMFNLMSESVWVLLYFQFCSSLQTCWVTFS